MILQKNHLIILGLIIGCGLAISLAVIMLHQNPVSLQEDLPEGAGIPVIQGGLNYLELETAMPNSPGTIPMYSVVSVDHISEGIEEKAFTVKQSVPSADEAPSFAEKGLEKYGGLPRDARLDLVVPNYQYKYNVSTNAVEEQYPVAVQVFYNQMLNDLPVLGSRINIQLGENGEIIGIVKTWGNYAYAGEVEVISAERAYEKLKNYETTDRLQGSLAEGTKIKDIQLGYRLYWTGSDEENAYLKPIWIFYATDPRDSIPIPLMVDAQKNP